MKSNLIIDESTLLTSLPIPYLEVVLSEVFLIMPKKCRTSQMTTYPERVCEVAAESGIALEELLPKLRNICDISTVVSISAEILLEKLIDTDEVAVVDLRTRPLNDRDSWSKAYQVNDPNLGYLLQGLKTKNEVICICDDGAKSYSGAMYLRGVGFTHSFFVLDGVQGMPGSSVDYLNEYLE